MQVDQVFIKKDYQSGKELLNRQLAVMTEKKEDLEQSLNEKIAELNSTTEELDIANKSIHDKERTIR